MRLGSAVLAQNKAVEVAGVCWCTRSYRSSATAIPSIRTLFIQMFQIIVQSSQLPSFYRKSSHQSPRFITFELIQIFFIRIRSTSHRPILASSAANGYWHAKKQIWYPDSSALTNYLLGDWRIFDDSLYQKLLIFGHVLNYSYSV